MTPPQLTDEESRVWIGYTLNRKRAHVLLPGTWTARCSSSIDIVTRTGLNNQNRHKVNCARCRAFLATIRP